MEDARDIAIDRVPIPGLSASIGLCSCPGGRRAYHDHVDANLTLERDLEAIRGFGAVTLLTLLEDHELKFLGLAGLGPKVRSLGMDWQHLPIEDLNAPNHDFEREWQSIGPVLRDGLRQGRSLVVHCWAGLGRSGTVAARLLVELGLAPDDAIEWVRRYRLGAIQSRIQEKYVLALPRIRERR